MSSRLAKSKILAVLFAIGWNAIVVSAAMAQGNKGTVTGRVTDSTESILQAAQVVLQPTGASAVSAPQGQFFINDLEPGSYSVTITTLASRLSRKPWMSKVGKSS